MPNWRTIIIIVNVGHEKGQLHELGGIRKKLKQLRSSGKREDGVNDKIEAEVEKLKIQRKEKKDKVKVLYAEIIQERKRLKHLVANEDLNTYKAIVSFLTEEDKISVLKTKLKTDDLSRHFT